MKTMATPRPVLRLNHNPNSLSLGPTSCTRRGQQPLLFKSSKSCVVVERIDFKDVVIIHEIMLMSAVVYLAIHPTNQPILPNWGNQPTSRPDFGNQSNLRGQIAGWLVVDHPGSEGRQTVGHTTVSEHA
jgi:hypothetical protein